MLIFVAATALCGSQQFCRNPPNISLHVGDLAGGVD
jgi:hypothetical protein